MTGLGVVQRREVLDPSPTRGVDHPFAQAAVQIAHELGIGLGELTERAVQELDPRAPFVGTVSRFDRGLETEAGELRLERVQAALRACTPSGVGTPDPAGVGSVGGVGTDALRERGEQPGEQRVGRRVEPQRRRAGGEEIEVLRTSDRAASHRLDVDEAGLTEPLEVQSHRVGVEPEPLGKILRRERRGRACELPVHREAGLVAERLQNGELVGLTGHRA